MVEEEEVTLLGHILHIIFINDPFAEDPGLKLY